MSHSDQQSDVIADESVLDSFAKKHQLSFSDLMPRVASEFSKPLASQLREIVSLTMRGNKLSVDEYYEMKLFDDETYSADEKKRFVGLRHSRKIWNELLQSNSMFGLLNDKLAFEKMMAGFGISVPETQAIFGGHYPSGPKLKVLSTLEDLEAFLGSAEMPIFGKPIDAIQSLGSARFEKYDRTSKTVMVSGDRQISTQQLFDEINTKFEGNYLFQTCVQSHPFFQEMCDGGLPTLRVVTLDSGKGHALYRACAKLTSKGNVADNFWRSGNMLAPIDLENGKMGAALTQLGLEGEFVSHHPLTNAPIAGVEIPYWQEATQMALTVAKILPSALIIGFDIAITASGPVIIEANGDPHLIMLQVAHQKGVLDQPMLDALDHCAQLQKDKLADYKLKVAAERKETKMAMKQATSYKAA